MSPSEVLREIAYPFTNTVVLAAMLVFFGLVKLAIAAGLFGLWLLLVVLPAVFRFLIDVVDARIIGRELEPPGIEMFSWIAGAWTLMPFALLVATGWAILEVSQRFGTVATAVVGLLALLVYPASMAILALTRSVRGSINPVALSALIRICGPTYFLIPAVIAAGVALFYGLYLMGVPRLVLDLADIYLMFLLFTLTGAVVARSDAPRYVENPDPTEPDEEFVEALAEKQRVKIVDHAYGLVSRGNRDGGFAHIETYMRRSPAMTDDYRWFFEEMLRWEDSDPALFFAQRYLHYLLDINEQQMALKLLSRCQLESPRWRPLPEDRDRALELAQAHGRDDLVGRLS